MWQTSVRVMTDKTVIRGVDAAAMRPEPGLRSEPLTTTEADPEESPVHDDPYGIDPDRSPFATVRARLQER